MPNIKKNDKVVISLYAGSEFLINIELFPTAELKKLEGLKNIFFLFYIPYFSGGHLFVLLLWSKGRMNNFFKLSNIFNLLAYFGSIE